MNQLHTLLFNEELTVEAHTQAQLSQLTVLFSSSNSKFSGTKSTSRSSHNPQAYCQFHNAYSHFTQEYRANNKGIAYKPSTSTKPFTCQICLKQGHTANVCYQRLNTNYTPPPPWINAMFISNSKDSTAAPMDNTSTTWYTDSGAQSHITPDFSPLQINTPYQGSDVVLGNGQYIPVTNSGYFSKG